VKNVTFAAPSVNTTLYSSRSTQYEMLFLAQYSIYAFTDASSDSREAQIMELSCPRSASIVMRRKASCCLLYPSKRIAYWLHRRNQWNTSSPPLC
jgi:hypothetical protein